MPASSLTSVDVQQLIDTRRDLHAHPELAFEQTRTSGIVIERLKSFGLHVWQDLDLGKVGVTAGPMMAAVDAFRVTITGRGTHAAAPEKGIDPVACLAHVITALQTIASREVDPLQSVVVSVTQLDAGSAFNIIPPDATIRGTVRAFDKT